MSVLDGIRILELGRVPPLELPGMMLADMGADVLKIETAAGGERDEEARRAERRSHTNRNKRSIALNLKSSGGQEVFRQLARETDVIIEGFRPGVMKRLGVNYEEISVGNPRVVYCSLSGFGQTGPYRDRPAHDLNFLALSGALGLWAKPGAVPDIPLNLVADYGGASMHGALAIVLALFDRERTGRGQSIDISYLDATIALLAATPNMRQFLGAGHTPAAGEGVFCGGYAYYSLYAARDGLLLSVACSEPPLWHNFCDVIGRPGLAMYARQPAHYRRAPTHDEASARQAVATVLAERDRASWLDEFAAHDVCVAPVHSLPGMLEDPHVQARGTLTAVEHADGEKVPQFASALRLSRSPPQIRRAAPLLGEHTDEVLASLGISESDIATLRLNGAVM